VKNTSYGDFYLFKYRGVRLYRYTAALTISSHSSYSKFALRRIVRALSLITPPERSAPPFCAYVSGAEGSSWIDCAVHHLATSGLVVVISPSHLIILTVMLYCFFRKRTIVPRNRMMVLAV
jgi:hypothetical protein